jgi:hypothetical protein
MRTRGTKTLNKERETQGPSRTAPDQLDVPVPDDSHEETDRQGRSCGAGFSELARAEKPATPPTSVPAPFIRAGDPGGGSALDGGRPALTSGDKPRHCAAILSANPEDEDCLDAIGAFV